MAKSIDQRIKDAFPKEKTADAEKFADKILDAWKNVSTALGKIAILFFVLVGIFELLVSGKPSASFTVGSFTFANTSVVRISIPAIVSYLIFDGYQLVSRWTALESAYIAIIKICAPSAGDNDLDLLIKPSLPSVWGIGYAESEEIATRSSAVLYRVKIPLALVALTLLPLAFEVQAYYILFYQYGYRNVFLWISAVFSAAIVISLVIWLALGAGDD